jgi:glutamine amidotransferase-like uncharacterized protein
MLIIQTSSIQSQYETNDTTRKMSDHDLTADDSQADLFGVKVAIYEGYANSRVTNSLTALTHMFEWMNATVTILNETEIANGSLWEHEILAIPEGLGPFHQSWLGAEGLQAIREWVSLGGSYIGVRGSAAMAVTKSYFEGSNSTFDLGLFNGTSIQENIISESITEVLINQDCEGPDLSSMPANLSVLFVTGRYFVADEGEDMIVIARYAYDNEPCMIATKYGSGRVFLSSPQLEYEENSERDGTDYKDHFDDPDSEWPLMLTVSRWLLDNSTWTNQSDVQDWIPLEILVSVGGFAAVGIILVLVVLIKRR